MNIRVSRQNAAIISLWFIALGFIFSLIVLFFFNAIYALVFFAFFSLFSMLFGTVYFSSFKLFIGKTHVSLRHGRLLKFTHRMPRRFVTGCHIISSVLQRQKNICILIILCSSGFYIVPGITLNCAQKVVDTLVLRSKE